MRECEGYAGNHEAGDWPGDANIKQRCPGADGRANANERARRPDEGGRGNKKGKSRIHSGTEAVHEVTHLVRKQDQQQDGGERNSQQQARRFLQRPANRKQRQRIVLRGKRGEGVIEVVFEARANYQRGKEGGKKKQQVKPVTAARRANDEYFRRTIKLKGIRLWRSWFGHRDGVWRFFRRPSNFRCYALAAFSRLTAV